MASFICSPLSIGRVFQNGKSLQRRVNENTAHGTFSGQRNTETYCKLRNSGGFRLPPQVPPPGDQRKRAIELLGCSTQRKRMRSTTAAELKALIGAIPPNRLIAQQWKGAIQRDERKAKLQADPNAFRHRHVLLEQLKLPEKDSTLSRCFILLDCLRRRYLGNQTPTTRVIDEVIAALGNYPKSTKETHHYIRTLAYMNRERRARERLPPQMPLSSIEKLQHASMLLGTFSVQGSVGSQTEKLQELLGAVPRNKNVATWWKKAVAAAIRKKKRRQRAAKKQLEDDAKRLQRRLRKLERERKETAILVHGNGQPPSNLILGEALTETVTSDPIHQVAIPTHIADYYREEKSNYLSRLYRFIGRFFVLKR